MTRAPYGRRAVDVLGSVPEMESLPTYYRRPAVKPSDWRWLIITYVFVGGLAGSAQVIGTVVDLIGHTRDRPLVSIARYLALAGAVASPVLLISDLKTPSRWYNMLRIFRGTSPMSVGSWTLFGFGGFSGLAALAQLGADLFNLRAARTVARLLGVPAALLGALLATYTGSLLAATSTPLWASAYRWLPAVFGLSGTSTAIATLTLLLNRIDDASPGIRRLERLALLTGVLELVLSARLDAHWKREHLATPLEEPPIALAYRGGAWGMGILAPLCVHLIQILARREMRRASICASVMALVGGYSQRAALILAGKRSAERPREYFQVSQ